MPRMNVLVVGNGGREHALSWKLREGGRVRALYVAPGNGGTAALAENVSIPADDIDGLVRFAAEKRIDLTVVGPEAPLVAGLADRMRAQGLAVFGPSGQGARLEGSKLFAKEFMERHGIPTASFLAFDDAKAAREEVARRPLPFVVKADGLAAGKGVRVVATREEAVQAVEDFMERGSAGQAGRRLIVEDALGGEEISLLVVTDGERSVTLPASQDHKRIGEGDTGPNTGGMGAYAPAPRFDEETARRVQREIVAPTLAGLRSEGIEFRGVLYAGLMMTENGPHVLEYNVRFGDPETQAVLPLLRGDFAALLESAARGALDESAVTRGGEACLCVVLASDGYPGAYRKGFPISGLDAASSLEETFVFHAGTLVGDQGELRTTGGRVLTVAGRGADLRAAAERAYRAAERITFENRVMRRDIGWRALGSVPGGVA